MEILRPQKSYVSDLSFSQHLSISTNTIEQLSEDSIPLKPVQYESSQSYQTTEQLCRSLLLVYSMYQISIYHWGAVDQRNRCCYNVPESLLKSMVCEQQRMAITRCQHGSLRTNQTSQINRACICNMVMKEIKEEDVRDILCLHFKSHLKSFLGISLAINT